MNRFTIANIVRKLKPGQRQKLDAAVFRMAGTTPDDVMQLLVGAAYELFIEQPAVDRPDDVTFGRLDKPVDDPFRTWVSPDRSQYYTRQPNGLFKRNDVPFMSASPLPDGPEWDDDIDDEA